MCPCQSQKNYSECCEPLHLGKKPASSAEALMRSRYSAFAFKNVQYLWETLDPDSREDFDFEANQRWAEQAEFLNLEILKTTQDGKNGRVEFKADFRIGDKTQTHHEISRFRKINGRWYFREGKVL